MDNKISAALILSLGLVISAMIISHNGGIRFIVEIPSLKVDVPTLKVDVPALKVDVPKISVSSESDIGRYQRFSRSDEVSSESGCFDTTTGIEFRHAVVPGSKINKFIQSGYKSGQNILLSDDCK